MADESLADIATAVADGTPVDWESASGTLRSGDDLDLLDGLKLVADLTRARGVHLQPPPETVDNLQLQEWGPLRVIERVGHGTFGDVYRFLCFLQTFVDRTVDEIGHLELQSDHCRVVRDSA